MTRELKFRVRCKKTNQLVCCYSEGLRFTLDTGQLYGDCGLNVTDYYYIEQYTGRKDKNNDELYKDDIVQWMDDNLKLETGIIEWDEEYAGWGISGGHCLDWSHAIEKIGNIHQNPELLK